MAPIAKLQRHWEQWGNKLEPLVKSKSARLHFPPRLKPLSSEADDFFLYGPERPICITNAPVKSSSTRARSNLRLVMFIDGDLKFSKDAKDPCITHKCNLTIFKYKEVPHVSAHLEMVDTMHFDVDAVDAQGERTPFHPIFHVQRGPSHDDTVYQSILADILHLDAASITVDQVNKAALGTPYLRIPTPQLDMFALFTLIAADYFCNPGDVKRDADHDKSLKDGSRKVVAADRSNVKEQFVALLDLLKSTANLAREGVSAVQLRGRLSDAAVFSTACWYPESGKAQ